MGRSIGSLLLTGLAVELALMPIGLFHFHKTGIYGSLANLVAIPFTTFIVMPLEALAMTADLVGVGAPVWWLAGLSLEALLWLARTTAGAPGSVAALPAMPVAAYALIVTGGIWVALWRTRWRCSGFVPFAIGIGWALATPEPDLLVTGDGRHVASRDADGRMLLLRERAGDYVRGILGEAAGLDGDMRSVDTSKNARCSRDVCVTQIPAAARNWIVTATRSADLLPIETMVELCRRSDIVISERRLPRTCNPQWLKLDRPLLKQTGGIAIALSPPRITKVRSPGAHPWQRPTLVAPPYPPRPPSNQ